MPGKKVILGVKAIQAGISYNNRDIVIVTLDNNTKRLYYKSSMGSRHWAITNCWSRFHGLDFARAYNGCLGWVVKPKVHDSNISFPGWIQRLEGPICDQEVTGLFEKDTETEDFFVGRCQDIYVVYLLNSLPFNTKSRYH